ncbi:MAG: ATP-dependent helicase [Gammaproteobacteria bacterium WSBS_2016_MAG_OTU1]
MSDILNSLNQRQQEAVCHEDGGLLVLAGAGTGKTRVLTSRIAWLIARGDCPPNAILAVTFTNKAAKEMRQRIFNITPPSDIAPLVGTFHGICHRILRRHAAEANWDKNFQILDAQDQKSFIRRLLTNAHIDMEEYPLEDCRHYINNNKERGIRAADAIVSRHNKEAHLREIYASYEVACRRENKMDFSELLLSCLDLLRNNASLKQHYATRFRHILIDEFQDTNSMQYEWLRLLDSGDNVFFAVGDDDQSIYAFRGAEPKHMRKIGHDLRASTIIRLEENYRSTGNILTAANGLIASNKERLGKKLFTSQESGAQICITASINDIQEADNITESIRDNIAAGSAATDIAVLYRTNAQSRLLEKSLIYHGMPYRIYGGMRFFDRQEVKHALAYMRLAAGDDLDALLRVINMPPRGIGKQTVTKLVSDSAPFDAIQKTEQPKIAHFRALLNKLRQQRADKASLATIAQTAIEDSGLLSYYESHRNELERAENLREFVSAAAQFQPDAEDSDEEELLAFLANAVLESGEAQGSDKTAVDAINLMTMHAAKGLEFSIVHVAGLEEGLFPSSQSLDSSNAIEEERRLMYVAITRARRQLFLYYAHQRMVFGTTQMRPPSRFLNELPSEITEYTQAYSSYAPKYSAPAAKDIYKSQTALADDSSYRHSDSSSGNSSYRPGASVDHKKYGIGVVLRCEGRGDKLKIEVAFKKIGVKTFNVKDAPIKLL